MEALLAEMETWGGRSTESIDGSDPNEHQEPSAPAIAGLLAGSEQSSGQQQDTTIAALAKASEDGQPPSPQPAQQPSVRPHIPLSQLIAQFQRPTEAAAAHPSFADLPIGVAAIAKIIAAKEHRAAAAGSGCTSTDGAASAPDALRAAAIGAAQRAWERYRQGVVLLRSPTVSDAACNEDGECGWGGFGKAAELGGGGSSAAADEDPLTRSAGVADSGIGSRRTEERSCLQGGGCSEAMDELVASLQRQRQEQLREGRLSVRWRVPE